LEIVHQAQREMDEFEKEKGMREPGEKKINK